MTHPPGTIDERQLEQLYREYNRLVYSLFVAAGFSAEEARDLVQETFLAAHRGRDQFRGHASPKTWLLSIAKNIGAGTHRDRSRLKRRGQLVPLEASDDTASDSVVDHLADLDPRGQPQQRLLADEQSRLLWNALDELPTKMRRMVILRLGNSLKYQEIADVLQVSINTVRSQLFEARGKLRDRLAEHFENISF